MTPFAVGTIIAPNYEAYARVLARSLASIHAEQRLVVLVLADAPGSMGHVPGIEVITPYELPLGRDHFHRMAAMYSVIELATALKPWLLRFLLARGVQSAIYLDPDTELFASLNEISDLAAHHGIVLTPHFRHPIPRDGLLPGEQEILISGTYNLGFIAVGQNAHAFLDWWQERLLTDCRVDIARGLFVDQRWIDLAVLYFRHHVLGDDGFNVAYWNLHEREVAVTGAGYTVNGRPLRLFHYSGYEPDKPRVLSKHTQSRPRKRLSENATLLALFEAYRRQLLGEGWAQMRGRPYPYSSSASGIPLTRRVRAVYRAALVAGREPPDPFDRARAAGFDAWLARDLMWYAARRMEDAGAILSGKTPRVPRALSFLMARLRGLVGRPHE
jgi:hypothetical protein